MSGKEFYVLGGQWLKSAAVIGIETVRSSGSSLYGPEGAVFSRWRRCYQAASRILTSARSSSTDTPIVVQQQPSAYPASTAVERISLASDSQSLSLVSRSGWLRSSSLFVVAFGCLLLTAGVPTINYAAEAGSLFLLTGGVVSLLGLLFLWIGFWSWGLRLEVRMTEAKLQVRRSFFDKPLSQQTVDLPSADRVFAKRTSETIGDDELGREYFSLVFRRAGVTHQLAEGIDGRDAAETLLAQVQQWLELHGHQLNESAAQES